MIKFLLAVISFIILSFALAYPWHLIWFHELYVSWGAVGRKEPIIALGLTAMLIQAAIIAYLYPFYQGKRHPIVEGVRFSWLMGLLVYSVMGPATAAKFAIEPVEQFLLYHTVFQFLQFTLTGATLGLIYGRKTKHASL